MMNLLPTTVSFDNDNAINKMNKDLHETIALLDRLGVDTNGLKVIQNELYVLNLFSNRQIVSIAGLQSVGKTSLIKRFLNFPEDLLLSEVGVGEKRPVLISADDQVTKIEFYRVKSVQTANGYSEIIEEEITKSELNAGVQNSSLDAMWYEIKMPRNEKLGELTLALLPGFERNKQSDSQKFLELFLNCSTGMILVLNHMRLAQASQHDLLDKVSKAYKDKVPGFVLTFAKELDDDQKMSITNNLVAQFEIEDKDQIVFSDIEDETVVAKLEKLIKQNSQYSMNSANLHLLQQHIIGEQLALQLMKVENSLIAKHMNEQDQAAYRFDKRQFTKYKEEYMKNVREALQAQISQHVEKSIDDVKDTLKDEKDSIGTKFKAFFKNELTYTEVQELKEWIKNLYTTEEPYKTNHMLIDSIGVATESYLNKRIHVITKSIEKNQQKIEGKQTVLHSNHAESSSEFGSFDFVLQEGNGINQATNTGEASDFGSFNNLFMTTQNEDTIANPVQQTAKARQNPNSEKIDFAVGHTLTAVGHYLNIDKDHFNSLGDPELQILPAIAGSIAQQAIATRTLMDRKEIGELTSIDVFNKKLNGVEGIKNEINNLSMDMNHVVKGAAVFFGIDALDGTFNSFGAVTGALEALGLAAGAATTVAASGVVGIAAAIAVKKGGDKLEKYKFEREQYAVNLLRVSGEFQVEATMQSIEKVFDDIDYQLEMATSYRKNEHSHLPVYSELQIRMSRLKKECGILRELAYRNESFIGKISATTV